MQTASYPNDTMPHDGFLSNKSMESNREKNPRIYFHNPSIMGMLGKGSSVVCGHEGQKDVVKKGLLPLAPEQIMSDLRRQLRID